MIRFIIIVCALFALATLSACGQKGPLKLPPEAPKSLTESVVR